MPKRAKLTAVDISSARRELLEVIETCRAIEDRRFNPFMLDIKYAVNILGKHFPHWKKLEDFCIDAHALNRLATVLRLQHSQLRFQSTSLYADPDFLEKRFSAISTKKLAEILTRSWHPTLEIEQITENTVREAMEYWKTMLPVQERWKPFSPGEFRKSRELTREESERLQIVPDETFSETLDRVWREMKLRADERTGIPYHEFVYAPNFDETIDRAYYVSFLLTYGYARLQRNGEQLILFPNDEREHDRDVVSMPISINKEEWNSWSRRQEQQNSQQIE
ncbi:MAG: hypothetical protein V1857_07015 [archaeon]